MNFKSAKLQNIIIMLLVVAIVSVFAIDYSQTKAIINESTLLISKPPIKDKVSTPSDETTESIKNEDINSEDVIQSETKDIDSNIDEIIESEYYYEEDYIDYNNEYIPVEEPTYDQEEPVIQPPAQEPEVDISPEIPTPNPEEPLEPSPEEPNPEPNPDNNEIPNPDIDTTPEI